MQSTQYRKLATLLAQKLSAMNIAQAAVHLLSTKDKEPQYGLESPGADAGAQPCQLPFQSLQEQA